MTRLEPDMSSPHQFKYLNWIVEARHHLMSESVIDKPDVQNSISVAKRNLSTLLGVKDSTVLNNLAQEILWNQAWSAEDQNNPLLLNSSEVDDPHQSIRNAANGQGHVFTTFHCGSYRLLPYLLALSGIELTLIADYQFVSSQGVSAVQGLAEAQRVLGKTETPAFRLLIAEDPATTVKAARRLKRGESVLLYLDGNTGVGGVKPDGKNLISVPFLNGSLGARTGAAFLSHLTHSPIVPVMGQRSDWLSRRFIFNAPIIANRKRSRQSFCNGTTSNLFAQLETYLQTFPTQWEGWLYVDNFMH